MITRSKKPPPPPTRPPARNIAPCPSRQTPAEQAPAKFSQSSTQIAVPRRIQTPSPLFSELRVLRSQPPKQAHETQPFPCPPQTSPPARSREFSYLEKSGHPQFCIRLPGLPSRR